MSNKAKGQPATTAVQQTDVTPTPLRHLSAEPLLSTLEEMEKVLVVLRTHDPDGGSAATVAHWVAKWRRAVAEAATLQEWYTVAEVADMARKGKSTVRWRLEAKTEAGKLLRSRKRGGTWEIHRDELEVLWAA